MNGFIEPFSYDLEIEFREHEQNNNRNEKAQFDWISKRARVFIGLANIT